MIALIILLPTLLGIAVAWFVRVRMRTLGWMSWIGVTLLGVGAPVLIGQLAALAIVSSAETGTVSAQEALQVQFWLAAGLAGGLGFGAGAISTRLTAPST